MAERRKPTDVELRAFSGHLLYEIEMFSGTVGVLAVVIELEESNLRTTLRNALMESWALHVRNLLSFLYDTRAGKGDAVAADFVGSGWAAKRGAKPDVLKLAHAKASKEMAHMSWLRSQLTDIEREWHHMPIIAALGNTLHAFLDTVPEALVVDGFHDRARRALPPRNVPLSLHALQVAAGATESLMAFRPADQ
jgi:hypothetical protein